MRLHGGATQVDSSQSSTVFAAGEALGRPKPPAFPAEALQRLHSFNVASEVCLLLLLAWHPTTTDTALTLSLLAERRRVRDMPGAGARAARHPAALPTPLPQGVCRQVARREPDMPHVRPMSSTLMSPAFVCCTAAFACHRPRLPQDSAAERT